MKQDHAAVMSREGIILLAGVMALVIALTFTPVGAATPRLSNVTISDAVEDELALDSAVPSYLVDIFTHEGIVTLSGTVDNILAKERAAKIAEMVKGVRAVVNRIEVAPPELRSDWQIREDVEDALLYDPATDSYEVAVQVNQGVVTLSGSVESWKEKELCGLVAKGVKGVKGLNNNITVDWAKKRPDVEIEAEVEKALEWDPFVDDALIDVEVDDGEVILRGIVGSAAEKSWASINAYVHGVKSVDDTSLEVERWARDRDLKGKKYVRKSAEEIEEAVEDALLYDPRVSSFKVIPEVEGSVVTLRGTVDNLKAKRAAAQDARNTVGVVSVENRIKVRPAELWSDEKIEEKIENAFVRDPYVGSYEITVEVVNGVANLYGTVDTYFEKSQADDVASRVKGVIMVDNHLVVQENHEPYTYDPYLDYGYPYDEDWYDYRPLFSAKSDRRIKENIEGELFWSPFVDSDDVHVTVDDGEATLTGTVESWSEYDAAENNAYEGGAVYVDNDLIVKWPSS